ncbi:hypothetical protein [Kitasatospora azatica]|uniref:hypothetical protein n=1 Tax=Kitasatospora azatica TaxID=58347 RepID=UPI000563BCF7|nr:hypothetical protein [Kitasatospora azatica]
MTTQGDSRSISDGPSETPGHVRNGTRGGSRRLFVWGGVLVALAAGGWVVASPHPGDWLPGLGPSSQDKVTVVGSPPPTSATDPNPFTVEGYFPSSRPIELNNYKGRRSSGGRQGNDCAETLRDPAKNVLKDTGCQGYLTVSISRQDTKVLTSVTVLRFADDAAAAKAAGLIQGQGGLLTFVLPDSTIASPSAAAAAKSDSAPRVEAVRHYVTVTTSRYADGHPPNVPVDQDLDEASRAASYTAGTAFVWS